MEAVKASRFGRCDKKASSFLASKVYKEGFKHKTNGVMCLVQALSTEKKSGIRHETAFFSE